MFGTPTDEEGKYTMNPEENKIVRMYPQDEDFRKWNKTERESNKPIWYLLEQQN